MRYVSRIILAAFLITVLALQVTAQDKTDYSEVIGTWTIVVVMDGAEEESSFIISVKNDTLKGVWSSYQGDVPMTEAKFEKGVFSGKLLVPSDYDYMTIEITAKVDGEKMKGKGVGGGMEYPFTGKRKKDK